MFQTVENTIDLAQKDDTEFDLQLLGDPSTGTASDRARCWIATPGWKRNRKRPSSC
jgi:hypothetical protein